MRPPLPQRVLIRTSADESPLIAKANPSLRRAAPSQPNFQIFALIFSAIFLLHLPLLRLPYFWDEAGYYIPAAYDFFTTGALIPHSVPSNAHPPLPAMYLALWWKLSALKPAVTRTSMLLLAALGLTAVFRIASRLSNHAIAFAVTLCTAMYPVWFAQSSLAHSDLAAAAFTLWGLDFYFHSLLGENRAENRLLPATEARSTEEMRAERRRAAAAATLFAIAALCKETAIVAPLTLAAYDVAEQWRVIRARRSIALLRPLLLLLSVVPLACWFIYHHHRTGYFFGNPEFFAYNVSGTLTPLRIVLSLGLRLWQILGYMNLWLLTLATLWVMSYPAIREPEGGERPRIALSAQLRIAALIVVNAVFFALVGGAVLARYLLPVYPLVILIGISTLRRRLPEWKWAVGIVLAGFLIALFTNPFGYIPPEDNLSYRNYVILHKQAADYLERRDPSARVLTAWPASDELTKPFIGYVSKPMSVVRIEDFSYRELEKARVAGGQYEVALLFSTKQEPTASLLDRWPWWERTSRKYFGFHRDLPPEAAAEMLGGRIAWERHKGQQWAAIVTFDRVEDAEGLFHHRGAERRENCTNAAKLGDKSPHHEPTS
jgi:4-amino-4-deoxy-L-arabinose transferase-like glycosyltransferase